MQGTSIVEIVTINAMFYRDGGSNNCPRALLNSAYQYNLKTMLYLQITPDPYLDCNGVFYNLLSANWSATDYLTGKNMSSVLSFGT